MTTLTEAQIQAAILDYLHALCPVVARINAGRARANTRLAPKGWSDIIGMAPDGRFLAVEVKRPGRDLTPEQRGFLAKVERAGGIAIEAHSVEEVHDTLRRRRDT